MPFCRSERPFRDLDREWIEKDESVSKPSSLLFFVFFGGEGRERMLFLFCFPSIIFPFSGCRIVASLSSIAGERGFAIRLGLSLVRSRNFCWTFLCCVSFSCTIISFFFLVEEKRCDATGEALSMEGTAAKSTIGHAEPLPGTELYSLRHSNTAVSTAPIVPKIK